MKTFDQSLIDTANIPMSAIDPSDMEDTTSEEFAGMRRVQQGCHNELTNREDFPFMVKSFEFKTVKGQAEYKNVNGKIESVYVENEEKPLVYTPNLRFMTASESRPTAYQVVYNKEKLVLFPTPDKEYKVTVNYRDTRTVVTDDELGYEIQIGSTLNLPERIQHLYFDALEYYVLAVNMRKITNPRYEETLKIFERRWQIFLRGAQTSDSETYFVI